MANSSFTSYAQQDQVRKALLQIIDQVIDTGESDGTLLTVFEYAEAISEIALSVIYVFDTTGIASLAKTYIQPICGPTSFVGAVGSGRTKTALHVTISGKAFAGSYGTWTKTGDGVVQITFVSSDIKEVIVTFTLKANGLTALLGILLSGPPCWGVLPTRRCI